jgi:hypothetical protein
MNWRKGADVDTALQANCCSKQTSEKCQSGHDECYDAVGAAAAVKALASHRLDNRPILPKESRRFLHVRSVYFDTTRPPSTIVRYLEEERVANRFPAAVNQRSFFSHFSSPLDLRRTVAECIFNFDLRAARL